MGWSTVIGITVYYLSFPCTILFNILLAVLAPVIHLVSYFWHGLLFPLNLLSQSETLYTYFGVAILLGLLAGYILHILSSTFIAFLGLRSPPPQTSRRTRPLHNAQDKRKSDNAWQTFALANSTKTEDQPSRALKMEYGGFLRRRERHKLLSQTIVEEDDDL